LNPSAATSSTRIFIHQNYHVSMFAFQTYSLHRHTIGFCHILLGRILVFTNHRKTLTTVTRGLTIKFTNSLRWKCNIPLCWISLWSPTDYSSWEAKSRCQRLVHPSKQFWNWFCGMAFRAAVVLLLMSSMSSKCLLFNISFTFGNRKRHSGLDSVNREGVPTHLYVY
jgi:hypothetical protein